MMRSLLAALCLALTAGTAAAQCVQPEDTEAIREALVQRVNLERGVSGRAQLALSPALSQAAQTHACDMATNDHFSHRGTDGSQLGQRIGQSGFRACFAAENIAMGQRSVNAVMESWMRSRAHRENILDSRSREIGLALAFRPGGQPYWVMVLGARC